MSRLGVIAALLVSIWVGWVLVPAARVEPMQPSPSGPTPAPAHRSIDEPAAPSTAPTPFDDATLAEQLALLRSAEKIPAATPVPARLWGQVLDTRGNPAAGRRLVATPILAPLDPELPYPSEAEYLRRRWREADWREKHRRVVTSAEDGSFDIDGLIGASYRLEAGVPDEAGEGFTVVTAVAEPVEPGWWVELAEAPLDAELVEVEIDLSPQDFRWVSLTVRPAGNALRKHYGRDDDWFDQGGGDLEYTIDRFTGGDRIPLTPGSVVFAGRPAVRTGMLAIGGAHPGPETLESNRVTWDGEMKPIVLHFAKPPSITLRVELPEGSEKALRVVGLLALPTGQPFEAEEFARRAEWRKLSGYSPTVTLPVGPGAYQVGVRLGARPRSVSFGKNHAPRRGGPIDGFGVVTVVDGPVELEIPIVGTERDDAITVEVVGPDGKLLRNQRLRLSHKRTTGRNQGTGYRSDRNADGTYTVHGYSEEVAEILRNPSLGSVTVHTHDRDLGPLEAVVTGGAFPRAVLAYHEPVTLHVDCGEIEPGLWRTLRFSIQYDGERYERQLRRAPFASDSPPEDSTTIDLENVAPGAGRLIAKVGFITVGEVSVSCAAGESVLVPFPLSPVHRTEFHWANGTRIRDLILEDGTDAHISFSSFDESAVRWLPPGQHTLLRSDGETQLFSVPATGPIWIGGQR